MKQFAFHPTAGCRPQTLKWTFKTPYTGRHFYRQKSESEDPLRILFCGTDSFSKESLKALNDYYKSPQSNITSIDVVTKTDKRVGRGRRVLRSPSIKTAAQELGLPLHQIDTFTGWQPPTYGGDHCNLIIAVSFGLLIPSRILGSAKYGGLNVHPSMLPDLRGPAPIAWAINLGRRYTGVSVQTLHPSRFDEGLILDQTPPPGLEIPDPDRIWFDELRDYLAPLGAKMLVDAIRHRLYIPPYKPVQFDPRLSRQSPVHAPKLTKELHAVDFTAMTVTDILRRNRATQKLHAFARSDTVPDKTRQIIFGENGPMRLKALRDQDTPEEVQNVLESIPEGVPFVMVDLHTNISGCTKALMIKARRDGDEGSRLIVIPQLLVDSRSRDYAALAAARAKFFAFPEFVGGYKLYRFSHPLSAHQSFSATSSSMPKP